MASLHIVASRLIGAPGADFHVSRWTDGRVWLSRNEEHCAADIKLPAAVLADVAAFLAPEAAAELERLRADATRLAAALAAARLALTSHEGLTATDKPGEYTDALNGGCDPNGAWDCYREATWVIDEAGVLAQIDAALFPQPDTTTGGRASTGGERTPASAVVPAGTLAGATAAGGPALATDTTTAPTAAPGAAEPTDLSEVQHG